LYHFQCFVISWRILKVIMRFPYVSDNTNGYIYSENAQAIDSLISMIFIAEKLGIKPAQ